MYADEMTSDWQTFGGVEWSVDDSGCLEIYPAADPESGFASGQLPDNSERDMYFYPWAMDNEIKSAVIGDGVFGSGSLSAMFYGCRLLSSLVLPPSFDTSQVQGMGFMFYGCRSLSSLVLPPSFDTSRVQDMRFMFYGCKSLASLVLPPSFDTSQVTDMCALFYDCEPLSSLVLPGSFDTSRVQDMRFMFYGCKSLASLVLPPSFDTSQVTEAKGMFYGCSSLARIDSDSRDPRWVFDLYHVLDEGNAPAGVISDFEDHIKSCYSLDDFDDDSGYKHCLKAVFAGVPFEDVLV